MEIKQTCNNFLRTWTRSQKPPGKKSRGWPGAPGKSLAGPVLSCVCSERRKGDEGEPRGRSGVTGSKPVTRPVWTPAGPQNLRNSGFFAFRKSFHKCSDRDVGHDTANTPNMGTKQCVFTTFLTHFHHPDAYDTECFTRFCCIFQNLVRARPRLPGTLPGPPPDPPGTPPGRPRNLRN